MSTYLWTYWTLFDHLVYYNSTSLIRSCPSCEWWVFHNTCRLPSPRANASIRNVRSCLRFSLSTVLVHIPWSSHSWTLYTKFLNTSESFADLNAGRCSISSMLCLYLYVLRATSQCMYGAQESLIWKCTCSHGSNSQSTDTIHDRRCPDFSSFHRASSLAQGRKERYLLDDPWHPKTPDRNLI